MVDVGHASTTAFATDAYTLSPDPSNSVLVSGSISMPKQLVSASGQGSETPPTVCDHAVLIIVVADYWSFSICLWPSIAHYRHRFPMP